MPFFEKYDTDQRFRKYDTGLLIRYRTHFFEKYDTGPAFIKIRHWPINTTLAYKYDTGVPKFFF